MHRRTATTCVRAAALAALACLVALPLARAAASAPTNRELPKLTGTAMVGQTLTTSNGAWTGSPTRYVYRWKRCNGEGKRCTSIKGQTRSGYALVTADVGFTIRSSVSAYNAAGRSKAAISARSAVVSSGTSTVSHLEYVVDDSTVYVYDMDHGQALVKTIGLPQTGIGVRGVMADPASHRLFVSYGGDEASSKGWVLAYDLVTEKVLYSKQLSTGIDSGAISPDGKRIYMPTGENNPTGIWNILEASDGAQIGTIQGGASAHNTIASADGRYVYLGGRDYDYLDVYETATGKVRGVGPLAGGVRPFTVNGANTLAFTTATGVDGFQVSSIVTGKVLFTVSFGSVPQGFPFTAPSHGISLSPDEKQLYVLDAVNKKVRVFDVSQVAQGAAPKELAAIAVDGISGNETPCAYDCGRGGWLQHSLDGHFVYVGDSGDVIETATRKVIATLTPLLNTKKTIEIDWENGVPVTTSTRSGVGRVP